MVANSPTDLERLEQELQNGEHKSSSPGYMAGRVGSAIKSTAEAALTVGRLEGSRDLFAVHYTSLETVISMLKSARNGEGYLRMYSASGFNDPNEGKLFTSVAKEISQVLGPHLPDANETAWNPAFVASFILVERSDGEQSQDIDPSNDLLFWRLYGREGTGCSLELSLATVPEGIREVTYGEISTAKSIESIDSALGAVSDLANRVMDIVTDAGLLEEDALDANTIIESQLRKDLKRVRYLYKDLTYRFEKEHRIVETAESVVERGIRPKFHFSGTQGAAVVKKYIEHPSLKLTGATLSSETRITLGPLVPNQVHAKEYIEKLLEEAKIYGPQVQHSKISYRTSIYH